MRLNNPTLQPSLSEKFSGIIWKIKVHSCGVIAIESRQAESKKVVFSALNFITGKVLFKEKEFEENWNLSLAFAGEHNIILNAFEHAETPETKGILSINLEDGKVLWQKFNISLHQAENGGLQVFDSRFQPRKLYWLDHLTGEIISELVKEVGDNSIIFPEIDQSVAIPAFINHGVIAGELSSLSYCNKIFLSFHEVEHDYLKQRLIVYQEDKVLIDDILISGIQKLQPEAFFIQQNHLLCVRNKEEIITYLV